uniref:RAB29 n=1 Tax=Gongylonema pulchrum TaxID=637853 RepID=A0A183DMX5_9BILA
LQASTSSSGYPLTTINHSASSHTKQQQQQQQQCQPQQLLFKILIIGDVGTGKSSIVHRYAHNLFSQHYKATVCHRSQFSVLEYHKMVRIRLWHLFAALL